MLIAVQIMVMSRLMYIIMTLDKIFSLPLSLSLYLSLSLSEHLRVDKTYYRNQQNSCVYYIGVRVELLLRMDKAYRWRNITGKKKSIENTRLSMYLKLVVRLTASSHNHRGSGTFYIKPRGRYHVA